MNEVLIEELSGNFYTVQKVNIQFFGQDFIMAGVWSELTQLQKIARYRGNKDWFTFTFQFISKRLGISIYKTTECIHNMQELGVLETKREGLPSRIFYKLSYDTYINKMEVFLESLKTTTKLTDCESEVRTNCENEVVIKIKDKDCLKDKDSFKHEADASVVKLHKRSVEIKDEQSLSNKNASGAEDQENKPKLVRRKPSIFPSIQVQELFRHWNNLGVPISSHKENPEIKTFKLACSSLLKACKKYSVDEIKGSMDKYYWLITNDTKLCMKAIGHKVNLVEFFGFSDFTNSKLLDNIKNGKDDKVLDGIDAWFIECLNTQEYLKTKFANTPKYKHDGNPEITKKLAQLFRDRINNNPFTPHQINMLIDTANDLVNFHNNMRNKLTFNANPAEKNSALIFSHYVIDALMDKNDIAKIQVFWMRGDFFKVKLINYFKKLGMLDDSYMGSNNDLISEENQIKRKQESFAAGVKFKAECKKVWESGLSKEEQQPLLDALQKDLIAFRASLVTKYGGLQ